MKKSDREILLKEKLIKMKKYEEALYEGGLSFIAGVDEVGRGPLAGPVVTAAVILPREFEVLGVDDSKKLSEKKRNELFEMIKSEAIAYGIGMADHLEIDEINILEATKLAMERAIIEADNQLKMWKEKTEKNASKIIESEESHNEQPASLCEKNHKQYKKSDQTETESKCRKFSIEHILIDALTLKNIDVPQTGIIKGDAESVSIAAASILAKVTRDRLMVEYHGQYPDYSFDSNKGYGTKAHYAGIAAAGICPIHRKSFLKNLR